MNSMILTSWMMMVMSQHVLVNRMIIFLILIQMRKLQELQIMVHVNAVCGSNK